MTNSLSNFLLVATNKANTTNKVYFNASNVAVAGDDFLEFSITEVGAGGAVDLDNGSIRLNPSGGWDLDLYEQASATNKDPLLATFLIKEDLNVVSDGAGDTSPSGTACPSFVDVVITDSVNPSSPISKGSGETYTCMTAGSNLQEEIDAATGAQLNTALLATPADSTKIAYRRAGLTGQVTSYAVGDDGWRLQNGEYDYQKQGVIPMYQGEDVDERDGTTNDWLKLSSKTPNAFGTLFVWTDSTGGQTFSSGGYVINHITGQGWVRQAGSGAPTAAGGGSQTIDSVNWATALSSIEASTLHGYNNWHLPNAREYYSASLFDPSTSQALGFTALGITVNWYFFTSTTHQTNSLYGLQFRHQPAYMPVDLKTTNRNYLMVRNHY